MTIWLGRPGAVRWWHSWGSLLIRETGKAWRLRLFVMPCNVVAWWLETRHTIDMSHSKKDNKSQDAPWGASKVVSLDDLWVVVSSVYHGSPAWRQVPLTLDPDGVIPKDFTSEVSSTTHQVMESLARDLEREALRKPLEFLLASVDMDRMIRDHVIAREAVTEGSDAMLLQVPLWQELADRLTPRVAQGILDGIRQSLSIHLETLPFNLDPPGQRDEQMVTVQELEPDPKRRSGPISGPRMVARTILGRAIWQPSVMPFLLPKEWIGNLLEARTHLSFSQVGFLDENGSQSLVPTRWRREDLINPVVNPLVSLPVSEIGFPPEPEKLLGAAEQYRAGSQARSVLELMGKKPKTQEWFTLVDFLEAKES